MKNIRNHFRYVEKTGEVELDNQLYSAICSFSNGDRVTVEHLALQFDEISQVLEQHEGDPFAAFLAFVKSHRDEILSGVGARLDEGRVLWSDLPFILTKGTEISVDDECGAYGGRVKSLRVRYSFFGPYVEVSYATVSTSSGAVGESTETAKIFLFEGGKSLAEVSCRPITPEEREKFTERGRRFRDLVTHPTHAVSSGSLLVDQGWFGVQRFRNHGRVMVDAAAMKQANPDYFSYSGDGEEEGAAGDRGAIRDEDLWMCSSRVYGFSFCLKKWGEMAVRDLAPVAYRRDAYDQLVLAEKTKKAVLALVDRAHTGFGDVIEGKGGGCIFLLHGPPGVGKTMTAEAVADYLGRPLYSVSAGELGVDPTQLEKALRGILDIAAAWNAVVLLDEADVYLEQRDQRDIVRNAMVGVFLRMLEYHNGVMFLTTNRVNNFDKAFFSRITMTIQYRDMDAAAREKVWRNLLAAAGAGNVCASRLAQVDLNGRQVKNVIRAAQALSGRAEVSEADLLDAIETTTGTSLEREARPAGNHRTKNGAEVQP